VALPAEPLTYHELYTRVAEKLTSQGSFIDSFPACLSSMMRG
jgi:hypothetical protein